MQATMLGESRSDRGVRPDTETLRAERVPGNGNGNAGNSPIRFRRVSDYDPFLTTDRFVAQIPYLVGSSQPLLLVCTVLHNGWIRCQTLTLPKMWQHFSPCLNRRVRSVVRNT